MIISDLNTPHYRPARFIYKDLYKPCELGNHAEISRVPGTPHPGESLNLTPDFIWVVSSLENLQSGV